MKGTKERESWGSEENGDNIRWERERLRVKGPRRALRTGAAGLRSREEGKLKWGKGRQLGRKKGAKQRKGGRTVGEKNVRMVICALKKLPDSEEMDLILSSTEIQNWTTKVSHRRYREGGGRAETDQKGGKKGDYWDE